MEKEYIQITSGRGPVECCRVVVLVMNKIIEQAKSLGYEVEIVEHEDGPNDGCMFSATLAIEGENISSLKVERSRPSKNANNVTKMHEKQKIYYKKALFV